MSALRTVRLPLRANVPDQCTRRTNAFAAARDDNTAMRPFAKLQWTLVLFTNRQKQESKHYCRQAAAEVTTTTGRG